MLRLFRSSRVGWTMALVVLLVALIGPFVAPHDTTSIFGRPFAAPDGNHWLGLDYLGHDVLSRVLTGGRSVVVVGVAASLIAYTLGITIGLLAGYRQALFDPLLMRPVDVLQAFPPVILVLLLVAGAGASQLLLIGAVGIVFVPGIARLVRAASLEVASRPFVEAAAARGESTSYVIRREILPNIVDVILADVGIRFTGAILLAASMNYLGLGQAPPAVDWGLMAAENRIGLLENPWPVLLPVALIALMSVGGNLIADGIVRRRGVQLDVKTTIETAEAVR